MIKIEVNKLYNIDCIEHMKTIRSESIDLIIADAPANGIVKDKWDNQWGSEDEYVEWLVGIVLEFERILKPTGTLYLYQWIGEKNPLTMAKVLLKIAEKSSLNFKNIITWKKDRGFGVSNNYMYVREEILFYTKHKKEYTFNVQYGNIKRNYIRKCGKSYYKRVGNVWVEIQNEEFPCQNIFDDINEKTYEDIYNQRQEEYSLDTKSKSLHSTQKPQQICDRLIKASSDEGDLVYIPFAGSGSEIVSCINNNRKWIATEINEEYINVIKNRIEETLKNQCL